MITHLSSGLLAPVLSFGLSFVGCAVGLSSTARSRLYDGRARRLWLWMGAVSIGGIGIWVMHFVAMLGFTVSPGEIRYDLALTLVSLLLAVVVVAAGLFLVDRGAGRPVALLAGGGLTGVGVASMHYLGMRAVHTTVPIAYDPWLVALSVVIGVLAATAALWLPWTVRSALGGILAAAVMALAVSGTHYTGMAAMQVAGAAPHDAHGTAGAGDGLTAEELVAPLVVVLTVSMLALVTVAILARAPREIEADQEFARWREALRGDAGTPGGTDRPSGPARGARSAERPRDRVAG